MRYRCRCSRRNCQARRTLAKHPDEYQRPPACPVCGNRKWYVDRWRHKNELHKFCWCNGAHYPHRYGSSVCLAHPQYGVKPEHRARPVRKGEPCPF